MFWPIEIEGIWKAMYLLWLEKLVTYKNTKKAFHSWFPQNFYMKKSNKNIARSVRIVR